VRRLRTGIRSVLLGSLECGWSVEHLWSMSGLVGFRQSNKAEIIDKFRIEFMMTWVYTVPQQPYTPFR
jgi:hypothetical protein